MKTTRYTLFGGELCSLRISSGIEKDGKEKNGMFRLRKAGSPQLT